MGTGWYTRLREAVKRIGNLLRRECLSRSNSPDEDVALGSMEQAVLIELEKAQGPLNSERERGLSAPPKIKIIDRDQSAFVSLWVENLVGADDKVRSVWDLTGRMELSGLREKIVSREGAAGRAAEDPGCWSRSGCGRIAKA